MSATCGPNFSRIGWSPDFLWPFEVFGPIGRNGDEKFKGSPKIFGDRYQKSVFGKVASCLRLPTCQISWRYDDVYWYLGRYFQNAIAPHRLRSKTILIYSGLQRSRSKNSSTLGVFGVGAPGPGAPAAGPRRMSEPSPVDWPTSLTTFRLRFAVTGHFTAFRAFPRILVTTSGPQILLPVCSRHP